MRGSLAAAACAAALLQTHAALGFGPDPTTAAASFRFVVMNDVHVSAENLSVSRARLAAAVDEINGLAPSIAFVLVAGDLGQSSDGAVLQTELEAARAELDRLAVPYHVSIGNHDVTAAGDDTAFRSIFGPTSYRFAHGGVQFVCLRTAGTQTSTAIPAAALDSLSARLAEIGTSEPLVVFAHHPLGPVTPLAAANAAEFWARVDGHALRAVVTGHWHGVFEEERNGAWYCTQAALSAHRSNHDDTEAKGYRLVSVLPDFTFASRFYALGQPPTFAPEPPVLAATGNRYAVPGTTLRLRVAAADADGDAPAYTALGLPAGATFDPAQQLFAWTPSAAQVGLHRDTRFVATDASGSDTLALAVRVLDGACLHEDFDPQEPIWQTAGGSWSVVDGVLRQANAGGGSYSCTAGGTWSDFYYETDVAHDGGAGYAGVVFRWLDANNNYYLWSNGAQIQLRRRQAGTVTKLGTAATVGAISGWHHVRVEAVGASLKVYWDGMLRLDVADSTFAAGSVGLVCSRAAARFDDVVVVGCGSLPGSAPLLAAVGDRTAYVGSQLAIQLAASDADGPSLTFAARDLPPGSTLDAAAGRFAWTPSPGDVGLRRGTTFVVSDGELDDAETVTFTVLDTTGACLYETFAGAGGEPTEGGGGTGEGQYVAGAAEPVVASFGSEALADFTLQARVRVEGTGSGNLAFRIVDATHYYYLWASPSTNVLELWKRAGDAEVQLAGGAEVTGSLQKAWHLYRVQADGALFRVWLDDVLVFEVQDAGDPTTGGPFVAGLPGIDVLDATLHVDDVLVTGCGPTTTAAGDPPSGTPPPALAALTAAPNPCNPSTTVEFELGAPGRVGATLHDAAGRTVRTLVDSWLPAGRQTIPWDGRDDGGRGVASGVYFVRVQAAGRSATHRIVLVK